MKGTTAKLRHDSLADQTGNAVRKHRSQDHGNRLTTGSKKAAFGKSEVV